jgi:hypothetical protein
MWEDDGDAISGTFVRWDSGPTQGYGEKPICVLDVEGETRSVWLMHTALYLRFEDEIRKRPQHELAPGERVVIVRKDEKESGNGRKYRDYDVLFPDRPQLTAAELFKVGSEAKAETAEANGSETNGHVVSQNDGDIPF